MEIENDQPSARMKDKQWTSIDVEVEQIFLQDDEMFRITQLGVQLKQSLGNYRFQIWRHW